jgi:hypothetical protein
MDPGVRRDDDGVFIATTFDEAAVQQTFIWMQRNSSGITTSK